MDIGETWAPIPHFEGSYEASSAGRIRSVDRIVTNRNGRRVPWKGRILRQQFRPNNGYYVVALSRNGKARDHYVHRLVLSAFRGAPKAGYEGCHGNDIRTDNRIENLRWDTHRANVGEAIARDRLRNHNKEKTHCIRGHEFTEANTVIRPEGRACRACRRLKERERYHARKSG